MTSSNLYKSLCEDLAILNVNHRRGLGIVYYSITIPGFRTVLLYRIANYFYQKRGFGVFIARFFSQLNMILHACDIACQATIDGGLHLPHPTGIVIGAAKIGARAMIYQNVTIGLRHSSKPPQKDVYPTLGEDILIAAGAVILGAVKVGNKAIIGANAVVLRDVPDHSTAIGVPARVLIRE